MTAAHTAPISRFPVPALEDLPEDIRERIATVQEKSGFIPNVFLTLAHRPDEFRAFMAYHDALMDKPGNLSKAEREMIVVATSSVNQCQYCVIAHGAILRIRAKDPLIADRRHQLPQGRYHRPAEGDARLRDEGFAGRAGVGEADFDALKSHGFVEEDVGTSWRSRLSACPTASRT